MRDVPFCKMNARQAEQDSRDQKGEKQNMKLYRTKNRIPGKSPGAFCRVSPIFMER